MSIAERPSPNRDKRAAGRVDMLVFHYTGMATAAAALDRLCDPAAKVSAHYLIDEDGAIIRLVAEAERAWHAGVAAWAGSGDINDRSIGIELVNPGHEFGYRPFPEAQMAATELLARDILARHAIPPGRVLGHGDVAPARRQDPGELFDWKRLAHAGIGIWPGANGPEDDGHESTEAPGADAAEMQRLLARFGYSVPATGVMDIETRQVVTAFQRHFRPARFDGDIDAGTVRCLRALLRQIS